MWSNGINLATKAKTVINTMLEFESGLQRKFKTHPVINAEKRYAAKELSYIIVISFFFMIYFTEADAVVTSPHFFLSPMLCALR